MPLYEYVCSQCCCRIEAVQKVKDPPLKECKSCGGALKKVISPSAIQFKGNGWSSPQKEEKTEEKGKSKEAGSPKAATEKPSSSSSKG